MTNQACQNLQVLPDFRFFHSQNEFSESRWREAQHQWLIFLTIIANFLHFLKFSNLELVAIDFLPTKLEAYENPGIRIRADLLSSWPPIFFYRSNKTGDNIVLFCDRSFKHLLSFVLVYKNQQKVCKSRKISNFIRRSEIEISKMEQIENQIHPDVRYKKNTNFSNFFRRMPGRLKRRVISKSNSPRPKVQKITNFSNFSNFFRRMPGRLKRGLASIIGLACVKKSW